MGFDTDGHLQKSSVTEFWGDRMQSFFIGTDNEQGTGMLAHGHLIDYWAKRSAQ